MSGKKKEDSGTLPTIDLIGPNDGEIQNRKPEFRWIAHDPDVEDDTLQYTLLISEGNGNPFLTADYKAVFEEEEGKEISIQPFDLEEGQMYSWCVLADDGGIGQSRSQIYSIEL